jgi:predicted DsbA family dithiol-disulfide isomerase
VAVAVGFSAVEVAEILASDRYAAAVREREHKFTQAGIQSVPAVIINDQYLISGGQPAEVFEDALRKIAAGAA